VRIVHRDIKPFCFVCDDAGSAVYRDYAAYLLSFWSMLGNGHGCGVAVSELTPAIEASHNLVYLGVPRAAVKGGDNLPFVRDGAAITVGDKTFQGAAAAFVFPAGDRLGAVLTATEGNERLLYHYVPFSARAAMPDLLVWNEGGGQATGFFDAGWHIDKSLAAGL
jgi:hypothetical protein